MLMFLPALINFEFVCGCLCVGVRAVGRLGQAALLLLSPASFIRIASSVESSSYVDVVA